MTRTLRDHVIEHLRAEVKYLETGHATRQRAQLLYDAKMLLEALEHEVKYNVRDVEVVLLRTSRED